MIPVTVLVTHLVPDEPGLHNEQAGVTPTPTAPTTPAPAPIADTAPTPSTGRPVFRDVRRQLSDEDLANPGVHRMTLEQVDRADAECVELRGYRERFHAADRDLGVANERLRSDRTNELLVGALHALGGITGGLAPYFWDKFKPDGGPGNIALVLGIAMIVGGTVARWMRR